MPTPVVPALSSETANSCRVNLALLGDLQQRIYLTATSNVEVWNSSDAADLFLEVRHFCTAIDNILNGSAVDSHTSGAIARLMTVEVVPALAAFVTEATKLWESVEQAAKNSVDIGPLFIAFLKDTVNGSHPMTRLQYGIEKTKMQRKVQNEKYVKMFLGLS